MTGKLWLSILIVFALLAFAGCGSQNVGAGDPPDRGVAAFDLSVMDESYIDGASAAGAFITVDDYPEHVVVNVNVEDANNLKALFLALQYDPEQYRPLTTEPTEAMGDRPDILSLQVLQDRGTVHYGQVLTNYEWRTGMTGDGVVAQIQFAKEATPQVRVSSVAPVLANSAPVLTSDGTDTLNWHHSMVGDYDQNSEVNIADLAPIGQNFQETTGGGPFPYTQVESVVDGDSNGEIGIADLTPIGQAFQKSITGYAIYTSLDAGDAGTNTSPATNDDHTIDAFDTVDFSAAVGNIATDRLAFSYVVATPDPNAFYWVRPVDADDSTEGTRSNLVSFGTPPGSPTLTLTSPPGTGDGSVGNPYVVSNNDVLTFLVNDPDDGDVSATATFSDSPEAGDFVQNVFTVNGTVTGAFSISAFHGVEPTVPGSLFFTVGGGGGGFFILPDPADTDWDGAPNAADGDVGTSGNPWVLHDSTFNPDGDSDQVYDLEFSCVTNTAADGSGTALNNEDYTWGAGPVPFTVIGINETGSKGTFQVNVFTNGYVFAQDLSLAESNRIYVVANDVLPN